MTIQNNDTRDQYTATAAQTVFPYTFEIFASSDLTVEQNGSVITAYTVSGVGNDSGGNVTLNTGATAGDIITIYRDMDFERLNDYQNAGDFLASEVNSDYDRIWAALQQLKSNTQAAIRPSQSDTALNSSNTELADIATRGGRALGFADDGTLSYLSGAIPVGTLRDASTTAAMTALTGVSVSDVVTTKEFSTGNGGGGTYDAVLTSSVTPNGYDIIQSIADVLISFVLRRDKKVYIEQFGVNSSNSAATNNPIFARAFDVMAGRQIYMKSARYKYDAAYSGSVNLAGEQRPTVNPGRTALENGSILEGATNFSGDYVYLVNLGVDHGSGAFVTGADAVKASASPYNSGRLCVMHGVVGLGRNDNDAFHGILVEGYEQAWIKDCVGAINQFCCAIKSRNVTLDGFRGIGGQNSIIFKSDTGAAAGTLNKLNANNIVGEGTANTQHGIRVLADSVDIQDVNISNANLTDTDRAITVEGVSALSNINITNINGRNTRTIGVVTAGALFNIHFDNINLIDLADGAKAFELQSGRVTAANIYASMVATGVSAAASLFDVQSGVASFKGDNIELVENFGAGITAGTLLLQNNQALNSIRNIKGDVAGNIRQRGATAEAISGSSVTLSPDIDLDLNESYIKISAAAAATVRAINPIVSGSTNVPNGYVVRLSFSDSNSTIKQFTGPPDNIRNRAAANIAATINTTLSYVWEGSSWLQLDNTA